MTGTSNDGSVLVMSGIETFLIEDGRITHVWNAGAHPGPLGMNRLAVRRGFGRAEILR